MFERTKQEISDTRQMELNRLSQEERARTVDECKFWTDCVQYMIDEETIGQSATSQVIAAADELLRARRERFPI